jgi:two-component system cell cycle sensor histidine kinase/response regulator CckA
VQSRPATESTAAEPAPPVTLDNVAGLRVLLVEDDDSVRITFDRGLRKHGLLVTAAADGASALRILDSGAAFDVLVSDVMMPGIDGVELAGIASQRRPGLKVVLMSGYAELPLHRAADAQGVRFLAKPFSLVDLVAAIGTQLSANR